jgi:hypothetical protein
MSKSARVRALSWPTSIYRRTPLNIAVRHLKQRWSRGPDARSSIGRAGPVTDRTRWSSLSSAPTNQWPGMLLVAPDATVPASGWSPVSSHNDRTRPVDRDRTRHHVRSEYRDTRKRWALTGRVRSHRDRVRSSVRSPLWPPFASVWFTLSHMS